MELGNNENSNKLVTGFQSSCCYKLWMLCLTCGGQDCHKLVQAKILAKKKSGSRRKTCSVTEEQDIAVDICVVPLSVYNEEQGDRCTALHCTALHCTAIYLKSLHCT